MRRLLDPKMLALLDSFPPGGEPLEVRRRLEAELGGDHPRDSIRALAEQISLRGRCGDKFVSPLGLLLTAKGLEQATPLAVARRRAQRILSHTGPGAMVLDTTAGLGADAIALARAGLRVVAAEADPRTAFCLGQNLRGVPGCDPLVLMARFEDAVLAAPYRLVDPDRRDSGGSRLGDPESWSPPFSAVIRGLGDVRGAVIKLAPATDASRIDRSLERSGAGGSPTLWEWVAHRGELKELALWTGELAGDGARGLRRAVSLSASREESFSAQIGSYPSQPEHLGAAQAQEVGWLLEPSPAVLAAGLLGALATQAGVRSVGPGMAYLASEERPDVPCSALFRVLGSSTLDPKRVRSLLGAHDIGPITVKRRGHPLDAGELARRLRGPGRRHGLVLIARLQKGHRAWLVEREDPHQEAQQNGKNGAPHSR